MNERSRTVPPPAIPLTFVALALATLGAVLGASALGIMLQPLALLHALALGVFATVALGLLYQFVPVVAQTPLRNAPLAFVHALFALTGTLLIIIGFQRVDFGLVRLGGEAHIAGLACEAVVLGTTLWGHAPPAPARGAAFSLLWLILTIVLGTWMAGALMHGASVASLLSIHGLAGVAGFFGTIIVAVSFRLLRMFERVDEEAQSAPFALGTTGATLLAMLGGRIGAAALVAVALLFGVDLAGIVYRRDPAYQRETLIYAVVSGLGALCAAASFVLDRPDRAVIFAVWFFVGAAVVGYLQRIVPFIWWIQRARMQGGPRAIPTLAQMNHSPLGFAILVCWAAAGLWFLLAPYARGASVVAVLAWIGLIVQLLRPFVLRVPRRDTGTTTV